MGGRSRPGKSVVDVVEAIYAGVAQGARGDARGWLGRVLAEAQGCVADAVGGFAYAYDISDDPASWRITHPVVRGAPEAMAEHIRGAFEATPPSGRRAVLPRLGPAGTFSAVTGQTLAAFGPSEAARFGALDAVHINALDASSQGVLVALLIPRPRRLTAAESRRLRMLSAHIASAMRLMQSGLREPDVVLGRGGRVAHASPGHAPSLPVLQAAALRIARAREGRADPDAVLGAWRALVVGRYSLIDRFAVAGRRYVVAFENPPGLRDPRGLSATEAAVASWACHGHPQKHIAYELGLSVGTVGGLLHRVFQKLGVRSRAGLIERLATPEAGARVAVEGKGLFVFESPTPRAALAGLTPAERQVARRAALGASNAEIARERGVSLRTVINQLASAFEKLGVRSRAELAARQP